MASKRGYIHRFSSFSNNTLLAHYRFTCFTCSTRSIVFQVGTGGTGGTPFVSISFQRVATQTKNRLVGGFNLVMTHQQVQFDSIYIDVQKSSTTKSKVTEGCLQDKGDNTLFVVLLSIHSLKVF
jgi:hypothetical protein